MEISLNKKIPGVETSSTGRPMNDESGIFYKKKIENLFYFILLKTIEDFNKFTLQLEMFHRERSTETEMSKVLEAINTSFRLDILTMAKFVVSDPLIGKSH